jgi:uncharacterized protein
MKRNHSITLKDWLAKSNSKPLILRGARQVGKSTLVRLFAEEVQRSLREVNLERFPDLVYVFAQKDPIKIIDILEALPNIGPITSNTILFLD